MKLKRLKTFLGALILVSLGLILGHAAYFGWPLSNPRYLIEASVNGCEILAQNENQIEIVAKSLVPEIIIKETSHQKIDVTIRFLNLSQKHELRGLRKGEEARRLSRRNGLETTISLQPDGTRKVFGAPKEMNYPIKFALFGDSEGIDNPFTNKHGSYFVWNHLAEKIDQDNLLFSIEAGDLLSSGDKHHWKRFRKRLDLIHSSFFPVLGNEDVSPSEGRSHFRTLFGKENYSFSYLDCHFIFLDNSRKEISPEQWKWLETELKENREKRTFLTLHIPPFYPNNPNQYMEGWNPTLTEKFLGILKKGNVEAVLGAHLHSFSKGTQDGVQYFISGGAGGKLDSLDPGYHFVEFEIEKDKPLKFKVVKLSNKPKALDWASNVLGINY